MKYSEFLDKVGKKSENGFIRSSFFERLIALIKAILFIILVFILENILLSFVVLGCLLTCIYLMG
jgi:hypothetical protein